MALWLEGQKREAKEKKGFYLGVVILELGRCLCQTLPGLSCAGDAIRKIYVFHTILMVLFAGLILFNSSLCKFQMERKTPC